MVRSWPWGSQFFIQLLTRACVLALPRTLANVFASVGLRMCAKWGKSFCFYVLWFFCLEYAFFLFFWGNGVLLLEKTHMTLSLSFSTGFIHFFSQWTTFISLNCGSVSLDRAWVLERQDTWDPAGLSCSLETHYFTRFIQYEVKTASKGASSISKVSWSQMKSLDMVGYAYSPSAREPEKWSFLGSVVSPFSLIGRVYANERAHLNTNVWPLRDNTQSYPPN